VRALIVIPCLNEREALPALLAELRAVADGCGHTLVPLVIDDGSSDGTAAAARASGARCVQLPSNLGIGGAVQTGLKLAALEGFDCAVQLDGDGQHPAEALPALLSHMALADAPDLLVGSRFLEKAGFQSTTARRVGIGWLCLVLRLLCGLRLTDPTSGLRVYGRRALWLFDLTYPYDYPEPESLVLACRAGLAIAEAPVQMRPRRSGHSSIRGLWTAYYMLKVTLAMALSLVRNQRLSRPLGPPHTEPSWSPPSPATGSSPPSAAGSRSSSSGSSAASA
jgi:glycosyltransferase involved in cell wall biosynthesis